MSLLAGQVHYLSATTPILKFEISNLKSQIASRPGAAPGKLSFGDSAAQLVRDLEICSHRSTQMKHRWIVMRTKPPLLLAKKSVFHLC